MERGEGRGCECNVYYCVQARGAWPERGGQAPHTSRASPFLTERARPSLTGSPPPPGGYMVHDVRVCDVRVRDVRVRLHVAYGQYGLVRAKLFRDRCRDVFAL